MLLREDGWYDSIERELILKENKVLLYSILDKLPRKQREAYVLHKIEGKINNNYPCRGLSGLSLKSVKHF